MSGWQVELHDHEIVVALAEGGPGSGEPGLDGRLPIGVVTLGHTLASDPPRPEELTNAIGAVADHLDDLVRARPDLVGADVTLRAPEATAVVAVELGCPARLPFVLERAAAEDVFRTVATESRADRARNPGLDPLLVDRVVAGACAVVAVMRKLQLGTVTVAP
jgi:exopolyphosphatase/guanosine-5'-triphosphate,3'-diphosphate pyrophosphatase